MPGGAVNAKVEELTAEQVHEALFKVGLRNEDFPVEFGAGGRGGLATVCLVGLFSALGGGLFGLDIGYISGVVSMESLREDLLGGEEMSAVMEGALTGVFALGAVLAAFPAVLSVVVDRFGRAGSVVLGGVIFCLGALLQAVAPNLSLLYVGRSVAGAAVGLLSANIPIFQGEIAPPSARGAIVALYQLAITVGIMVAFWTNYGLQEVGHGWRLSIALQLGPGLVLVFGGLLMPNSPRWLVQKGRVRDALATLRRIRGPDDDVRAELAGICREHDREAAAGERSVREFCSGVNGWLLVIGVVLQLVQQMCGLNLFMYYGPVVFQRVFRSPRASFLFSAVAGIVNFLSTFPAIFLADRVGRMVLLRFSAAGMALCCVVLASVGSSCFAKSDADGGAMACGAWSQWVVAGAVFLFIFNFAYGWGPVIWIYCAEMFPTKYRTQANGLTTDANWAGNFLIGFLPPMLIANMGFATFWIFAAINVLGLLLACCLPETKGRSLEDVQELFESWLGRQPSVPEVDPEEAPVENASYSGMPVEDAVAVERVDVDLELKTVEGVAGPQGALGLPRVALAARNGQVHGVELRPRGL